ncbi:MAG TPA: hypothetical protein VLI05_03925 [Candidatus Saccharimonadia bacterium]|nr:hypothetical protein [Candidatus Saccharimonadia bacterium]
MDSPELIRLYALGVSKAICLGRAQRAIELTPLSARIVRQQLRAVIDEARQRLGSLAEQLADHCTGLTTEDWLSLLLCQGRAQPPDLHYGELVRRAFFHLKNSNNPEVRPLGYMVAAAA